MKVCIASIHAQCEKHRLWRELQWQFISENTSHRELEYYIVANGLDPSLFQHADGVVHLGSKTSHAQGLVEIRKIFDASEADFCLLLDSDCWPIRENWLNLLMGWVEGYSISAPVRTENLDVFPHPCAVFFPKASLPTIEFGFGANVNLVGDKVNDIGGQLPLDRCYPLLKTNYVSPHPVYAAVYGDVFYHHCAGSRGLGVRCANYYRHLITLQQQKKIYNRVTQQLRKDPRGFINALRGVQSRVSNLAVKV